MTILPKLRTRFGENVGVELFISPPYLGENNATFLSEDWVETNSLTVDNGLKFSVGEYILIGAFGGEKSEIIRIHTLTTPTATAITLSSTTSFAHNRGEKITFIPYNQIAIERSTDGGSTYSALTTVDIRADSTETYYNHTSGASTDYYRVRFSNSASSNTSSYSDGIIATGFAPNSVGEIVRDALVGMGEKVDNVITKEFLYTAFNEGRDELDRASGAGKWSFRTSFDYDAGNVIPGHNTLSLPSTLRKSNTYENILSVRIGRDKLPLHKTDKNALNRWYQGIARTMLSSAVVTGATILPLTSSGDFDESGDVKIAGAAVSDTIDTVSYTGNTESSNTLTGVTGVQAAGHASGAIVWQGASFGYPTEYTVFENMIQFSQPFDDELAGENIWLDFYTELTTINSDADTLDEPYPKVYIPYLRWRVKKRRNPSLKAEEDDDYKMWVANRDTAVSSEFIGQPVRISVDVPC